MVIRDIQKEDGSFKLLVEEQTHENLLYRISDSYAPAMDVDSKKISISYINENNFKNYAEEYCIIISHGELKLTHLFHDKKRSTHFSEFLSDDNDYYFKMIINNFETFINSTSSEFTDKAKKIYEEVKTCENADKIGVMKNAV